MVPGLTICAVNCVQDIQIFELFIAPAIQQIRLEITDLEEGAYMVTVGKTWMCLTCKPTLGCSLRVYKSKGEVSSKPLGYRNCIGNISETRKSFFLSLLQKSVCLYWQSHSHLLLPLDKVNCCSDARYAQRYCRMHQGRQKSTKYPGIQSDYKRRWKPGHVTVTCFFFLFRLYFRFLSNC